MNAFIKRSLKVCIQLLAIVGLIFLDQKIKQYAAGALSASETKVLIPGILGLTYAQNTGAAFSLFASSTGVLTAITAIALAAGVVALIVVRKKPLIFDICLPLIIAGGGGNLIDRFMNGYVVDYLQTLFMNFPIFNFADCLVTCSCIAVIIYLIVEIILENRKKRHPQMDPYIAERESDD